MLQKNDFISIVITEATRAVCEWKYDLYCAFVGKEFKYGEQELVFAEIAEKHRTISKETVKRYRYSNQFKELIYATSGVSS